MKDSFRERVREIVENYWWVLLLVAAGGYFLTDVPFFQYFKYVLYTVGIGFALMIFLPFVIQFFAPAFVLVSNLLQHFREAREMSFSKKYIFVPMSLISATAFATSQVILSVWAFVLAFGIWASIIGTFLTFILTIFFGLAPLAIVTAPFVAWYREGFVRFADVGIFLLLPLIWFALSRLAFTEDYSSTPEDFLGYSHHIFLLGALSLQVIAFPFYHFGLLGVGEMIAEGGGTVLLLLAVISVFKWRSLRKKLSSEDRESLYEPPGWVYVLGFLFTNIVNFSLERFEVSAAINLWLNIYFAVILVGRFVRLFTRRSRVPRVEYGSGG